jgi:hypothetical protein
LLLITTLLVPKVTEAVVLNIFGQQPQRVRLLQCCSINTHSLRSEGTLRAGVPGNMMLVLLVAVVK